VSIKERLHQYLFPRGNFAGWQGIEKLAADYQFPFQRTRPSLPFDFAGRNKPRYRFGTAQ